MSAPKCTTVAAARAALLRGDTSASELAEAHLATIAQTETNIGAWQVLDPGYVRSEAGRADTAKCAGALGGIGVGVKDVIATADLPTAVGSDVYAGYRPEQDAECIARLRASGAYVFGKTVTTPFAYMDPAATRNPWNAAHSPGGSSSGSAAAVAAGHVLAAIGTQTNGSIVRPASYCGVVGYKPTIGTIGIGGVHPWSPTLDTVGTFARSVADAALVASVLADVERISPHVVLPSHRPRLAWLSKFPWSEPDFETLRALADALERIGDDAEIVPIALPEAWRDAKATHRTIMIKEGAETLGDLQMRERARLTDGVNAAIDEGRTIKVEHYREALVNRERGIAFFTGWLDEYDAVLSPAAPTTAPQGLAATGDPSCCTLWSLLGFPAVTLPVGMAGGLPVGLQFAAPQGRDDSLLAAAAWCEARLPFTYLT